VHTGAYTRALACALALGRLRTVELCGLAGVAEASAFRTARLPLLRRWYSWFVPEVPARPRFAPNSLNVFIVYNATPCALPGPHTFHVEHPQCGHDTARARPCSCRCYPHRPTCYGSRHCSAARRLRWTTTCTTQTCPSAALGWTRRMRNHDNTTRRPCSHNLANWDVLNASTVAHRERHLAMLQRVAAAPCSARFARRIRADYLGGRHGPRPRHRRAPRGAEAVAAQVVGMGFLRACRRPLTRPQLTSASGWCWSGEWGNSPIGETNHALRPSNALQCTHAYAVVNVCLPAGRPSASRDPSVSGSGHGRHDVYCRI
jgi:hypothetical protein